MWRATIRFSLNKDTNSKVRARIVTCLKPEDFHNVDTGTWEAFSSNSAGLTKALVGALQTIEKANCSIIIGCTLKSLAYGNVRALSEGPTFSASLFKNRQGWWLSRNRKPGSLSTAHRLRDNPGDVGASRFGFLG